MIPDFVMPVLTTVTLLAMPLAGTLAWRLRQRSAPVRIEPALRQAQERIAALEAENAELAKEQDLFQRMQQFGKTGHIVSDLASNRVYWSDSLFEIRRVPRREYFTFDEAIAFVHPDDRPKFAALRATAIAERRDWELDNRILRGDGTISWEHAVGRPQFDAAGNLTGALVILQDVTERVTREEENQRLSLVATNTNNSVIISNLEGRIEWVNAAFTRTTGYSLAEVRGQRPLDLLSGPASDPATIEFARERARRGEGFHDLEMQNYTKKGEPYWVNVELSPIRDADGKVTQVISVGTDITARKAAEAELKASHEKFAGAFHGSTDAMGVAAFADEAGSGAILDVNEAAERLFGKPRSELVGQPSQVLAELVGGEALAEYTRRLRSEGQVRNYPVSVRRRDGSVIDCLVTASRFLAGSAPQVVFMLRDVTEARRAERRIGELNASLEASLRQVRAIADNLPALVVYLDAERRFRFMNRTAERWLAASFKQIEGKTVEEAMPEDYVQSTRASRDRLADGQSREEVAVRYPDGVTRTVDATYVRDVDGGGVLRGYYVLAVDITERKAADLAMAESRAMFAGAFRNSIDAMVVTAIEEGVGGGRFVDVNAAAAELIGYSREELVGHTYAEIGHVVDLEDLRISRKAMIDGRPLRNMPFRVRHKNGRIIDTLASGSTFTVGSKTYYITVTRDVTEARAAERKILELNESLAASLGQLRAIADNLPAFIIYIDAERRYRFLNRTAERWLCVTAEAALGRTVDEMMPADFMAESEASRSRLLHGAHREQGSVLYPDGVRRSIEMASVPDLDADGQTRGYYIFGVDISERTAIEEQLRQSQKLEAIGKLTGGVAHDFNNLLAVISGNLELADEALEGREDVRNILRPAIRATERGAALTQSLLAYARQQPLRPSAVDLSFLVREMTGLLRRTIPMNIEFKLDVAADLWQCHVDAGQVQNALLNLVVNARDAMPNGGRLTIEIANAELDDDYAAAHAEVTPGDYVMLAVSDTGTGMAHDVAARAFEPFFTTKGVGKGTGLGLSMVFGFAKQSLGHVKIYSEVGHGTTVRVYLPRVVGAAEAATAEPVPVEVAGRGEIVLVVEDDPDLRTVAFALLRSLGYDVLEAAGAEAALRILQAATDIALMLTDVVLAGGMNGRQLAERAAALQPHMQVLYMSGYTENAILHHGRLDQGVNFLQKPFSKQELARKVRAMLNGRASA